MKVFEAERPGRPNSHCMRWNVASIRGVPRVMMNLQCFGAAICGGTQSSKSTSWKLNTSRKLAPTLQVKCPPTFRHLGKHPCLSQQIWNPSTSQPKSRHSLFTEGDDAGKQTLHNILVWSSTSCFAGPTDMKQPAQRVLRAF